MGTVETVLMQNGMPAAAAARASMMSPSRRRMPFMPVGATISGALISVPKSCVRWWRAVVSTSVDGIEAIRLERRPVVTERGLVFGAAFHVLENEVRQAAARDVAQVADVERA